MAVNKGVSIIIAIFTMLILSVMVLVLLSMLAGEINLSSSYSDGSKSFYCAETGIERGIRSIRDDEMAAAQSNPNNNGFSGTPSIDAYEAVGTGGTGTDTNVCFYEGVNYYTLFSGNNVDIYDFQQRYNLFGTTVKKVEIACRARRWGSGSMPSLRLSYSINGGPPWITVDTRQITNTSWTDPYYVEISVANPALLWDYLIDQTANFQIRALHFSGTRQIRVDYLALRVTIENDVLTEPWAAGTYATFPITVGDGNIKSINIADESGKININYASTYDDNQTFLRQFLTESGITPTARVNLIATRIVEYRNGTDQRSGFANVDDDGNGVTDDVGELGAAGSDDNPFNTIEEIKLINLGLNSLTASEYNSIKDNITVYSWLNNKVTQPLAIRAPININTASQIVLESIFDTLSLGASDPQSLAAAIISQRSTIPFSSMYSTNPDDTSSFATFVNNQSAYLTAAERNRVKENADASFYNTGLTTTWSSALGTPAVEFCYYSNTFSIQSTGAIGSPQRSQRTVKTIFGSIFNYNNYLQIPGSLRMKTYFNESDNPTLRNTYWKEIF
jgi:type II secretory pathway component PulK